MGDFTVCRPSSGAGAATAALGGVAGAVGYRAHLHGRSRSRRHREKARLVLRVHQGMLAGALDSHLDIATFQFELGDILLD